jgi:hypothetical protein
VVEALGVDLLSGSGDRLKFIDDSNASAQKELKKEKKTSCHRQRRQTGIYR